MKHMSNTSLTLHRKVREKNFWPQNVVINNYKVFLIEYIYIQLFIK